MNENKNPYTLITGAGAGLGKAFAFECAKQKMNIILVSLWGEKLKELCHHLAGEYHVKARYFETDLTKKKSILDLHQWITDNNLPVNMLINNAGTGGSMPFDRSDIDYIDRIIMLNIRALSLLSRLLISELKKHPKSYILNVSSMTAYSPIPYKTVYPASKAFVYSFSRSLREELKHSSINVCVMNPGPILTNADVLERIKRQGWLGKVNALTAQRVAKISLTAMLRGKLVIVPGIMSNINLLLIRIVPCRFRLLLMSRVLRREFAGTIHQNKKI